MNKLNTAQSQELNKPFDVHSQWKNEGDIHFGNFENEGHKYEFY